MESTISPIEAKEHLKSKKFGELVRIEFSNKGKIQNEKNDENIFFDSSIHDIEDAMWLLDDTPQVVFQLQEKLIVNLMILQQFYLSLKITRL